MPSVAIDTNIERLRADMDAYHKLANKSREQSVLKQGGKLGFALRRQLFKIAPQKGEVRSEAMQRLRSGGGIFVRKSIRRREMSKRQARSEIGSGAVVFGKRGQRSTKRRGKRLNLQALMVQAEINLREQGRGFLAISAARPRNPEKLRTGERAKSRYGPTLSTARFTTDRSQSGILFDWGPSHSESSSEAAVGLQKPDAQTAINRALSTTAEDIEDFLEKRLAQNRRRRQSR